MEGALRVILTSGRLQLKCAGTRWRTGGEVKGKMANGVGSHYSSHTQVERRPVFFQPAHGTATYRCDDTRGCI